ncbi:ABC-type branched-subunit amino acid transport system substrate-binding protein [Bradyrhizobium sp. CIR18]|uniref:ABC transporter substrate-binding protein n=1 Tax=Bradyrhizobium sp. CIR18 TaxID=2663839 RepID=UPI00160590AA|nr:ABC transporter substrate-binding protein [Bradyrhizobium sp. CIR18]MBB4363072.1 ABC-type branched-subunit amino acid transport system substrate-binding protein [Bradyrhizobium sp. CIR18]
MVIQFSGLWVSLGFAALIATNPAHAAEKIGVIAPRAGASAGDGLGMVDGARLAVDESNAAGGVAGYQPQVVMGDRQNMSREPVTCAVQRLTNDPDLNAVINGYADYSIFQIKLMAERDMPYLLYTSMDSTRTVIAPHPDKFPTIWSSNTSYDAYKTAMIPVLHSLEKSGKSKLQNKQVALISTDNPYSKSIINGLKKSFEEDGRTVTSADLLPTGEISDWRTFLIKVRLDNQAVVINTAPRAGHAAKSLTRFIEQPTNSSRTFGSSRSVTASGSCFLRSSILMANSACRSG